ncbi:MAG: transporter ATP-binding protein putative oligo/dipeptide transport protein [Acidimicrobiaceae bacterium]|jgi:oligopeptide/dipeptide ABC transporter ATP-binding protein|nr:transporter ATP-binding protein putative oligo/dipeptide transport protein [Acidimicrobiaceae bacterium]
MTATLEVEDLSVRINSRRGALPAVQGVSFEVQRGQAFGLVGESGSGKSITLKALLGLLPPEAAISGGHVRLDGEDLVTASQRRLRQIRGPEMSMVFQEPMSALNPVMRVGDQIAEGPRLHLGLGRSGAAARAVELMRKVGIPDPERRFRSYPHQFSGGMRQRVMIAIALSCNPRVVLCDEPTTALDVTIQDQILRLLTALCAESGTSLVFVTHDLPVIAQVCQTVAVMYAGRILERGPVSEIFREPRHPYTLGLLRSAPNFEENRSGLVPIAGSPPSLRSLPGGCPFHPRCPFATEDCSTAATELRVVAADRVTACIHDDRALHAQLLQPVIS